MLLTLAKKELREIWLFAMLALGIYLIYVSQYTGLGGPLIENLSEFLPGASRGPVYLPFVSDGFTFMFGMIGIVLAIAIGFRQSAWEPSQGTSLYLLHLPLSRRTLFLTKLAAGISLLLACGSLPILAYGSWAALPRSHPGPFEWSMTLGSWRLWSILPLFYLGAFASGLRPARWLGSRLLPLVSVLLPAVFIQTNFSWWLISFPLLCLTGFVLVGAILWIAETRDY